VGRLPLLGSGRSGGRLYYEPSAFLPGSGHGRRVSARSDWSTSATFMSFMSAPYVNNPGAGS